MRTGRANIKDNGRFICQRYEVVLRDFLRFEMASGMMGKKAVWKLIALAAILIQGAGCGYRIRSSVGNLPASVQSLGVPTFRNLTNQFKIEQTISRAVLKEFSIRTRAKISSRSSGVDAVLAGEILEVSSTPATFGDQTFGSAFLVTVRISAKLINSRNSSIVWQKDDFLFRERYALNSVVRDFFSEENPALERLARDFAASLVSAILENRNL